ncbi:MAG: hypothetical protein QF473_41120, partial [Planctomycetota bacterium]|nr:hypothetical protein [Planctomycetota bacterium]
QPLGEKAKVEPITNFAEGDPELQAVGHRGEVLNYLIHFEECLRTGRQPCPNALDATRVVAALEAVRESARTGQAVEVAWDF